MEKFKVYISYNEDDKKYVAVCPEFFGFIIYSDSEKALKKSVIHCLKVYAKNPELNGTQVDFINQQAELELSL